MVVSLVIEHRITISSSSFTCTLKRIKSKVSKRHLYTQIHSCVIYSSQKIEATQVSINRWMEKQNVLCGYNGIFSSVQSLSHFQLIVTPWIAARQASLSITNSWSLPKLMSVESVMPFNDLILSSLSPPGLNLSQHQGLFKWVSSSHQVAKVLEFQLQHQSFQWTLRTALL